jgi:hypothetical protein
MLEASKANASAIQIHPDFPSKEAHDIHTSLGSQPLFGRAGLENSIGDVTDFRNI